MYNQSPFEQKSPFPSTFSPSSRFSRFSRTTQPLSFHTLPFSVRPNPCICHSYANTGGVYQQFPIRNRLSPKLCVSSFSDLCVKSFSLTFNLKLLAPSFKGSAAGPETQRVNCPIPSLLPRANFAKGFCSFRGVGAKFPQFPEPLHTLRREIVNTTRPNKSSPNVQTP